MQPSSHQQRNSNLQQRILIISITFSREEENTCRKLCRELERKLHLSLYRENFHFWKVTHQQYKWFGLATWITYVQGKKGFLSIPVPNTTITTPTTIVRAGGRPYITVSSYIYSLTSYCILLDWQSSSFPEFLLERELWGTWAAIVQNTEVKD